MNTQTSRYEIKTLSDKQYKLVPYKDKPIAYRIDTPDNLIEVLERARQSEQRYSFKYGDMETGEGWNEEHETQGRIGLSKGTFAYFPLIVHNDRSLGGGTLMTDRILKIVCIKDKYIMYQHPKYKPPTVEIRENQEKEKYPEYSHVTYINGELEARHRSLRSAQIYANKINP
jgi:hypothetical protein